MSHSVLHDALARCVEERLTFAAFRVPGQPVQLWAQRSPELETVDGALLLELNQVFLLAPFRLDAARIPFIRADIELAFVEIDPDISRLAECTGTPAHAEPLPPPTAEAAYASWIAAAHAAFASGELRKVVLSRTFGLPLAAADVPDLFVAMLQREPTAFVAMAFTPEQGLWVGASPEQLVHAEDDHVRVDALAGTQPAGTAPPTAGGWGAKERDEQELVTTRVMRTFVELDLQRITTQGPSVRKAGPVAHLHTVLEADLGERLLSELVLALHPTPAVCGTPTDAAQQFIAQHETHDRGLYTGFWGPWNADGPTDLFVNIRCMRIHGGSAELHVGAGITAGSDPAAEWEETEHKADSWRQLLRTHTV
ncbi:MAG: chorismate-binding protein [Flavobacteriales bacterium]